MGQILGAWAGFDAHRRQQHCIRRHRAGREPMRAGHRPWRRVEDVAQARRFGMTAFVWDDGGDLTAGAPLQHHHRQPRFFFEFGVGEVILAAERRGVDLPEDATPRMLGKLLEGLETQRCDSSRH